MEQLDALGLARRARGVDQRRQIVGGDGGGALGGECVGLGGGAAAHPLQRVEGHHPRIIGQCLGFLEEDDLPTLGIWSRMLASFSNCTRFSAKTKRAWALPRM